MSTATETYTADEMMAVEAARRLNDGTVCFVGIGLPSLAANLAREEVESAETSITVQAFADFFAAQWPRTFNKMHFAAQVRRAAEAPVPQGIGTAQERSVALFDRPFTLPGGTR